MAYKYPIKPNTADSHQINAWWFAVVVRFAVRDSFNHEFGSATSKPDALTNPVEEDPEILIIDNDMINWQVTSAKASHVSSAQMTLMYSGTDYVSEIAPDDWIMIWAFDNKKDFQTVRARAIKRQKCNNAHDGLKFVGRVDGCVRSETREPHTGRLMVNYSLTSHGFSEFDSQIYYNPLVTKAYPNTESFMQDFGVAYNDFVLKGLIHPGTAIPDLLSICLGVGPGEKTKQIDKSTVQGQNISQDLKDALTDSSLTASPNRSYRVPLTIGKLLGREAPSRAVGLTYIDILNQIIGIQSYDSSGFMPEVGSQAAERHQFWTKRPLDGDALPYPVNFNNVTVWALLGTYLNAPINEMYTCMRLGPDGVVPTFVARQLPLSSKNFVQSGGLGTAFLDLPRWVVDERMVRQLQVGRSNAQRFNYVFLQGQDTVGSDALQNTLQGLIRNPPITDPADIMRAGLRMYQAQVSGTIIETQHTNSNSPGRRWSHLMSDILMGGHLKFTGSIMMEGVQAPICEGDNLQVKGNLYHIEQITHQGSVDALGMRQFTTSCQITNGISVKSERSESQIYPDLRGGLKSETNLNTSGESLQDTPYTAEEE